MPVLGFGQAEQNLDLRSEIQTEGEIDNGDEVMNGGFLIEDFSSFLEQALDINSADYSDLSALPLLSKEQIDNLLLHRKTYGPFRDMEELQVVPDFDSVTIRLISDYLEVTPGNSWKSFNSIDRKHSTNIFIRSGRILEKSDGYKRPDPDTEPHYHGDPYSVYMGLRHRYLDKLSFGILGEKDPGESLFREGQKKGFDFYSAHLSLNINHRFRQVIIGDYQVHFGQGLCFSSNALGGKSSDVLLVEKNAKTIRPNFSANESVFLRGLACEAEFGQYRLTGFYSSRKLDANENKDGELTSLYTTGLHRNEKEQRKKNRLLSNITGVDAGINTRYFRPGVSFVRQELSRPLVGKTDLYNVFIPTDRILYSMAFHYNFDVRNMHFFGETARAGSNGNAMISGVIFNPDPRIHLTISYRNYSKNYTTAYSSSFSENSTPANEKGLFTALKFRFNRRLNFSFYIDYFRFPWLKFQVDAPSWGMDRFSEINLSFSKKTQLSFRLRCKEKQQNLPSENTKITTIALTSKFQFRSQFTCQITEDIRLRSRWEFVTVRSGNQPEKGYLSFQEIKFKRKKTPIALVLRFTFFETEDYSSRIYAYEQDVPGTYTIPAHYGHGSRVMILTSYKVNRHLQFYVKFAQSIYEEQKDIGTSWDRINGQVKSELKLLCKMDF